MEDEPDHAYRALLAQELRYCIKNQDVIQHLAERTYKRVRLGKDQGLVVNSCAFMLLEEACEAYHLIRGKKTVQELEERVSMKDRELQNTIQTYQNDMEVTRNERGTGADPV